MDYVLTLGGDITDVRIRPPAESLERHGIKRLAELATAPVEARITEVEDAAVGSDLPVPVIVGRRGHAGHRRVEGLSAP